MIDILKQFNYSVPNLNEYFCDNLKVVKTQRCFTLFVNNYQWNNYNFLYHDEAFQIFSHYYLAEGHCICTGLGFGVREQWLLNNPNVTKITVLEKNKEVINYHKWLNNPILDKLEIIETDANNYKGSCDTLLLDHFEQETDEEFLKSIQIVSSNINHKLMWAWSIEPVIEEYSLKNKTSLLTSYFVLKEKYNLNLPIISKQTLSMFLFMFYSRNLLKVKL